MRKVRMQRGQPISPVSSCDAAGGQTGAGPAAGAGLGPGASDSEGRAEDLPQLRRALSRQLPTDGDLEAFCLDYFPAVQARFSSGMDRLHKYNLLLTLVPAGCIRRALAQTGGAEQGDERPPGARVPCSSTARAQVAGLSLAVLAALTLWIFWSRGSQRSGSARNEPARVTAPVSAPTAAQPPLLPPSAASATTAGARPAGGGVANRERAAGQARRTPAAAPTHTPPRSAAAGRLVNEEIEVIGD